MIPVLGYVFPFFAERVAPLDRWSVSHFGQILDHGYGLAGQNADIVVFGDSSAIFGVDTVRLSRQLGLKVINIPGTLGTLPITGDRTLRLYLAGNRPPRLIVFYFTPWNMDFNELKEAATYEGEEQMVRHEPLRVLAAQAVHSPEHLFEFPFQFYVVPSRLTSFTDEEQFRPVQVVQGHSAYVGTAALPGDCVLPESLIHQTSTRSVQQLVHTFTTAQTRTLVYLAPLPDCRGASEVAAAQYAGVDAAPPVILPSTDFADHDRYVHALAPAEDTTTDLLQQAVQKALAR